MSITAPTRHALSPVSARLLGVDAALAITQSGRLARGPIQPAPRTSSAAPSTATHAASGEDDALHVESRIASGRQRRVVGRERVLPFDLFLAQGHGALPLFQAGPFDELSFFQRRVSPRGHEVEYLLRQDAKGRDREGFRPFAVFRITPASERALPDPRRDRALRALLRERYGLTSLPRPKALGDRVARAFDPERGDATAGRNRLRASSTSGVFKRVGERDFSHVEVLELLRRHLDGSSLVGWVEAAFDTPPARGVVLHRYYLGADLRGYLVRDHWSEGKSLYMAEPSGGDTAHGLFVYLDR